MGKLKSKNNFSYKISKYLPVFIILLALSIIIGSTFAYFTDKVEKESQLTFSKVELSSETTTGINGSLRDVIPGTPLVDGALKFSKSIDSEPIYVRAKISFSLPSEYKNDEDMKSILDSLRGATDFNIISTEQHGAVWSAKDGNYFYLMEKPVDGEPTNLMRVDTIDTYVLSNEVVVPRDLKNLPDNAQYMKSINFHIAFEAIQADNVSNVLSETKQTFNTLFPEVEAEKSTIKVVLKGFDLTTNLKIEEVEKGNVLSEPVVNIPLDENNEPTHIIVGWYTDSALTNKYEFGTVVEDVVTLYPLAYEVSKGLAFTDIKQGNTTIAYSVGVGTCDNSSIVVPATYKNLPVTEVSANGFKQVSSLVDIMLPSSITTIGYRGFYYSTNLESITLPDGLTTLADYAFTSCTKLALTELPSSITSIGYAAFDGCSNLKLTSLPTGLTKLESSVFDECTNLALTELPSGITSIGGYAFYKCTNIKLSSLPSGLTSIDSFAFAYCQNITLTSLPSGITSLPSSVFRDCYKLALTSLPSGMTSIGTTAFQSCSNITLTELPSGLTSIKSSTFGGCSKLALTSLPSGITSIGDSAFSNCSQLKLTSLPSGITSIGNYAFSSCSNITLTSLPSGLTSISNSAFSNCSKLALTSLPSGITSIGEYAFSSCSRLVLTSLPSGITSIGMSAFSSCTRITLTELPAGITSIPSSAFNGCTALALTSLPAGVTSIGYGAFQGCSKMTISELPSGLTSLGTWTFNGCSKITISEIPAGITSLGEYVFASCSGIKLIKIPSSVTSINNKAFNNCTNINYVLCSSSAVATLVQGVGISDSYIYVKNAETYSGLTETEIVINDSLTVYQVELSGYMWIRNGSDYYKCIYMHDDSFGGIDPGTESPWIDPDDGIWEL